MRRWIAVVGWLLAARVAHAQPAHLAPSELPNIIAEHEPPAIDLLTFGVGDRIFEKYGHAALCLRYPHPDHPGVCFNYGVTDFAAGPVMIWDFLRNQQRFWVEPTSRSAMIEFYEAEDRDIWIQTLPIHGAQARALEDKLWHDVEEDHRYYVYDHFFDNCTTRLRDAIDDALGGALRAESDAAYPLTFRELGRRGLAEWPALLVATDLVIGRQADEHPTLWQAMFLPDVFRQQIEARLHVAPRLAYHRQGPPFAGAQPVPPTANVPPPASGRFAWFLVGLVFALPLGFAQWRRRFERAALAWLTVELAGLGVLVWGLAILSSIPGVRYNEAAFVVLPLDGVLPWLGPARRRQYAFARIAMLALISLLSAVGVLHQPLWILILVVFVAMATIALDLPHGLIARRGGPSPDSPASVDPAAGTGPG